MFPCLQGDGTPRGSSQSDLSDYMERHEELMDDLKKERLEALKEQTEIREAINRLKDEDEIEVLTRKYILSQTWEKIAEELECDRRTAIRKHGNALKNFEIPESCHCMSL